VTYARMIQAVLTVPIDQVQVEIDATNGPTLACDLFDSQTFGPGRCRNVSRSLSLSPLRRVLGAGARRSCLTVSE